ncbi:hypothetical protein [Dentiradicibacter hellwigii]|uniref:Uncharacterized protein n=1 Tax=Dentiradicibacter hellwigii TaxID=3149053 RepID=A0ABV4UC73_9RHOO
MRTANHHARWRSKVQGKHNTGQALPDFTGASTPGMPVHPDSQGKTLPKRMQGVALNKALRDVSKGVEGNKNTKSPCIMLITQGHIFLVLGLGSMGVNRRGNIRLPASIIPTLPVRRLFRQGENTMFLKKPLSVLLASAFVATAVQARDFRSADVRPPDYPAVRAVALHFSSFSLWIPALLKGAPVY